MEAGGNLLIVPSARRAGTNTKSPTWLGADIKSRLSNTRGIKVESITKESGFWSRIREATGTASPENITIFTYYPLELSEEFTPLLGIDFEKVVEKVSSIFKLEKDYIISKGRQKDRVQARDLVCYWSSAELGISMAELSEKLPHGPD